MSGAYSWWKGEGVVDPAATWTGWFLTWPAVAVLEVLFAGARAMCHLDDSGRYSDPCGRIPGGGIWHFVPFGLLIAGGVVAKVSGRPVMLLRWTIVLVSLYEVSHFFWIVSA